MTRVFAVASALALISSAASAHPHHDAALNLSHSHVGEVALVIAAVVVAAVAYRLVIARRR